MDNGPFTVRQVSKHLEIPAAKIRYYCNRGLVPSVKHSRTGYRQFEPWQVEWVRTLHHLERAGLDSKSLKRYVKLCRAGDKTIPERRALIATGRNQLSQELMKISETLQFLQRRDELLDEILEHRATSDTKWL